MNNTDEPIWMKVQRDYPQPKRIDTVRIMIEEKRRELSMLEREMARLVTADVSLTYSYHKPTRRTPGSPNWQASINGYHNPRKHYGWTYTQFLDTYLKRMATLKDPKKQATYAYVSGHRDEVMTYLKRNLSHTLTDETLPVVVEQTRR